MEPDAKMDDDLEMPRSGSPWIAEIIGVMAGLVPFFIHFSTSETVAINGEILYLRHTDVVALGGGFLALAMTLVAFVALKKTEAAARTKRLIAAVALAILSVVQLARGSGVF
jgi:hypothetical protein